MIFLFFYLTACGGKQENGSQVIDKVYDDTDGATVEEEISEDGITETNEQASDLKIITVQNKEKNINPQKIIKTAEVRFQVENLQESITNVQQTLKKYKAYVSSVNQSRGHGRLDGKIIIRVSNADFSNLLNELLKLSIYTDYNRVNAQDVSEEFVDIQTRLQTKKAVEKRYLEILEKAETIPDILSVEEKLNQIREEIEAKEGRLKYLQDQVSYSTITLEMYEETEEEDAPEISFWKKAGKGFVTGWDGFLRFLIGLTYIWPLLIILGTIIFFIYRTIRKYTK